eukprot:1164670-Prymnesium_polylepis.1
MLARSSHLHRPRPTQSQDRQGDKSPSGVGQKPPSEGQHPWLPAAEHRNWLEDDLSARSGYNNYKGPPEERRVNCLSGLIGLPRGPRVWPATWPQ